MEYVDIRASETVMLVVVVAAADRKGIDLAEEYRLMKEVLRVGRRGCGLLPLVSMVDDIKTWTGREENSPEGEVV